MKNITIFHQTIIFFTAMNVCSILHGRGFVLISRILGKCQIAVPVFTISNKLSRCCWHLKKAKYTFSQWECGGSVVERRTPEREVGGSKPTAFVLCP